mmetsp:Transcript_19259/g.18949  ORF Transcript_19259/g.18949 Transcript_19259/m.18949 type:complete len:90 (-) Transcript_19259:2059-2328(-)
MKITKIEPSKASSVVKRLSSEGFGDIHTPDKSSMARNGADYSENQFSRGIDTAATDTKSLTNTTERKRTGKGTLRRKRKNIHIRKLNKI